MAEYWGSGNLGGGGSGGADKSMILVTAPEGTVSATATYGRKTVHGKLKDGYWRLAGLEYGPGVVWTVSISNGAETVSQEQPVEKLDIFYLEMSYWHGELYNAGNQYSAVTGGWKAFYPTNLIGEVQKPGTLEFRPDSIHTYASTDQAVGVRTGKAIEILPEYKTLHFQYNFPGGETSGHELFGVNSSPESGSLAESKQYFVDEKKGEIKISVSNLSGRKVYPFFYLFQGSGSAVTLDVTKIWLD